MVEPWRFINDQIAAGEAVALLVVADHTGSTPGKRGFKLALAADGRAVGTIGGGIMEHRLVERVKRELRRGGSSTRILDQVHHKKAPPELRSGMICAGTQTIAVHIIQPEEADVIERLTGDIERGTPGVLTLTPAGLAYRTDFSEPSGLTRKDNASWVYREKTGPADLVCIIGGGHVGLALSRTLELLDFNTHVFDHRQDVATMRAVTCPKTVAPYNALGELVPEGAHVYAVIVTTGFDSDAESLLQLIGKDLKYLGLMGSTAKIKHIFEHVRRKGIDPSLFEKVRAPIGIPINNRTPAEIAISIAAELIQVRNRY